MPEFETILKSFRKYPKSIVYENDDNNGYKVLGKGDEFYSTNSDNLLDLIGNFRIEFYEMKIGRNDSFYWSGTINNDIRWIFSIGGKASEDGLFFTMNLQKADDALLEGLKKMTNFFNGQFKSEIIKKLHNNTF